MLSSPKFTECEPCWGIAHNENYRCVKWRGGNVVFSYAKRGDALTCHFAAKPDSLRLVKPAIDEFCEWAKSNYKFVKMFLATVDKPSVGRVIEKVGFIYLYDIDNFKVYARR